MASVLCVLWFYGICVGFVQQVHWSMAPLLPPAAIMLHTLVQTPPAALPAAVDNLFVFILVFSYFKTPVEYQPKVHAHQTAAEPCVKQARIRIRPCLGCAAENHADSGHGSKACTRAD